ncbi:hypothetical protein ABIF79_008173 [Bradyrhizobium japonicum]
MVCKLGPALPKFEVSATSLEEGERYAERWARKLASSDFSLTAGDKKNIASAVSNVAEFAKRNSASKGSATLRKAHA